MYTISEFAEKIGISVYTLRYYEKEGLIEPVRNEYNYRVYGEEDLDWANFVIKLKNTGISLKEIKKYTQLRKIGDTTIPERKQLLLNHRIQIMAEYEKVKSHLELLDNKISLYEQMEAALKK
ncbi:transcriptional regulator [Enterococcus ureilyticus]|uniref:Transcriptional regulator n=1 Tax=Enterococcus ureilyticus TaxID=1131292 RepID=A0A1E5HFY2_9ENTE|nr:MerR family transcriptional regulator [Enterococcus ureilyticus]MBM7688068.1 DNA-binding transcriptional MerR regulator [Enterococcus ureilyticus]MBO0446864.1 MerR family transcriptional regulator [Enterococcus ureilyticus]OEG23867.1 transcriptional regulator [Enterococcus ureilyticus]